jgi:hypothetical protein
MQWTEVDLKTRLMRKPKTKNGHSHLLPLPMQVIEVLQERPRLNQWFFPGKAGKAWSGAMARGSLRPVNPKEGVVTPWPRWLRMKHMFIRLHTRVAGNNMPAQEHHRYLSSPSQSDPPGSL